MRAFSAQDREHFTGKHQPYLAADLRELRSPILPCFCCLLMLTGLVAASSGAEADRWLTLEQGLAMNDPLLHPGKVDFLYRHRDEIDQVNAFAWSPVFKGGGGWWGPETGPETVYGGGFIRPLQAWPQAGELILGGHVVEAGPRDDYEFQGEYRLPMGLGAGGGFVEASTPGVDIAFGKLTFRRKLRSWNYILAVLGQEMGSYTSPGGYAALYNDQWMAVTGCDGEQWRVTGGFIAPENKTPYRPVMEVLYVDNSIGDYDGPRVVFLNASLKYEGGFLSHPARLGRAMGPQGLEFGNPLGFLTPTWNRRLEVWELGRLLDVRYERRRLPNRTHESRFEGLLFPAQFEPSQNVLDYVFVGGAFIDTPRQETPAIITGIFGMIGFLRVSVGVEHQFEPRDTVLTVGLIDTF